ncbi:Cytochrome b-c1 complex subunit 8-1, mitochondrial [Ancistrocladus abbreviatus]
MNVDHFGGDFQFPKRKIDCLGGYDQRETATEEQCEVESGRMGKTPVRMKAVVYALSPFQQKVMPGLWNDLPNKIHHKISENWLNATLLLVPVLGTYYYAQWYKEQEKLAHRY